MIDVRWFGRGGQGAFTAARLLGQIVTVYGNSYALASPSFGPERRGAPVWSFTRIDDKKIVDRSQPLVCEYLVVLDETLVTEHTTGFLKNDGTLIINTARPGAYSFVKHRLVPLDATRMALDMLGRPIANVAMLGAFAGISGLFELSAAEKAIDTSFSASVGEKNKKLLRSAYDAVRAAQC
jgi:pyruvate ferredoxin oxidoreductase gamma subunit